MRGMPRLAAVLVAAVVVGLLGGCSRANQEADLRTFLQQQPVVAGVEEVSTSTASFKYALEKRGQATVRARAGTTPAALTDLSRSLAAHLGGSGHFSEAAVSVVLDDSHSLVVTGVAAPDAAVISASERLGALPDVTAYHLGKTWAPNGLTADATSDHEVIMASPVAALAALPLLTRLLDSASLPDRSWKVATVGEPAFSYRCDACTPVDPAVVQVLAPVVRSPGVGLTLTVDPFGESTDVTTPDPATALAVQGALSGSVPKVGPSPLASVTVTGGSLHLHGDQVPSEAERAALEVLGGSPAVSELVWSSQSLDLTYTDPAALPELASHLPEGTPADLHSPIGSLPYEAVKGTGPGLDRQLTAFQTLRGGTVDRLVVEDTDVYLGVNDLTAARLSTVVTALRAGSWVGERRFTVDSKLSPAQTGDGWEDVKVAFTTSRTGTATQVSTEKSTGKVATARAREVVTAWDASAP